MATKPEAAPKPSKKAPVADVAHKPFGVLLASAPPAMAGGIRSGILSTVFHVALAVFLIFTTMGVGQEEEEEEPEYVELIEETAVPPPPPPPPPPELAPEVPQTNIISQLEMPTVILSDIPAPALNVTFDFQALAAGTGVAASDRAADSTVANPDVPGFTPMTVRPSLLNAPDIQTALIREYPAVLRDAGIGGAPVLWLYIGTDGAVQRTQVQETSGFDALDQAAANVAGQMRFSPAYNRDQQVAVWVQIPIRFQVIN